MSMPATVATPTPEFVAPAGGRTLFGHPIGLAVLFLTEMWERFSYYGMRGLLVLYMTDYLFLQGKAADVLGYAAIGNALGSVFGEMNVQQFSSQIYGLYTGLVYLTPFFGGMLADKILGQRKTVVIGGILMAIGHFLMAFETLFFVALFFLILGNGAFKPNISTQVGNLYPQGDPRRDRAFSIFYVGINVGAFFSNLVCGTLAFTVGWHYGFGAAGVGMVIGVIIYLAGQRFLAPDNVMKTAAAHATEKQPLTKAEWRRVWSLVILCLLNVVFWAVYEQQGNTMQIWADKQTIWPTLFGWQIPSPWFQSFNPFFIFTLTPLIVAFWAWQSQRKKEPSSVTKMAIGCLILGLSFIVMVVGAKLIGDGQGSLLWPVVCTLLLTVGELYLSPVGLSLVTKVAPARIVSMMMGMWFLSSFLGNYLSGFIGTFYSVISKEMFFLLLTVLGVGAGVAIAVLNRPLQRAMASTDEQPAAAA
ncbi:peptide MFS transporter [Vulgatibacter incomptus]|uniref:Di-/tripeptide transporter n=1 Tax=Vulgatibacter incomptus TaxID=1391653 RepID=A0A0K1PFV1_9BACT|nr:peptide MFS transporter [Vulgatibacter incomptus]AKU92395.1 Di-/tripeptide transporter [Vulgatibacter incomptus]